MGNEQSLWNRWGFKSKPFAASPLSMSVPALPIHEAFVGRSLDSEEGRELSGMLDDPEGDCVVVEGDIGVGKTSFVNYYRYLWEHKRESRWLSPLKEIPVYSDWKARDFLKEVLGQIANKLLYLIQEKKLRKSKLLKKIQNLYQIFYRESVDLEASLFGMSFGYRKNNQAQIHIPDLTESQLSAYVTDMIEEVKKLGYQGVFLHFDNLELLGQQDLKNARQFFEDVRDVLLIPEILFVFVCQTGFFKQVIDPSERVGSIMGWPIKVPPLSSQEVIQAVHTRIKLLSLTPGSGICPVTDSFLESLHHLYHGTIRYILDALTRIIKYTTIPHTLSDRDAEELLKKITQKKIDHLSPQERYILLSSLDFEEYTNEDLASTLKIAKTHISRALKTLKDSRFIYLSRRKGKRIFYKTFENIKILKGFQEGIRPVKKQSLAPKEIFEQPQTKEERMAQFLTYLKGRPPVKRKEYQLLVGIPLHTACREIAEMVESGKIKRVGQGRSTAYALG